MKIEIDIEETLKKMNIKKLMEDHIISEILDSSKFDDMVDELLDKKEMKEIINNKIVTIIEEYLSSEEGKEEIIGKLGDSISSSDILENDQIMDLITEFFKESLMNKVNS